MFSDFYDFLKIEKLLGRLNWEILGGGVKSMAYGDLNIMV